MKKSVLDNGMVLVTEHLPQFASLSIGVWVAAGSRHETSTEGGLSHVLEHMMFKGTKARSAFEIAQAVDHVGGDFNAFTTREYTCFHLLTLAKDLGLAVDILSDVILNSQFAEEELERERRVILQEIDMVQDNPEEYLYDEFFERALGGHALGRPILGSRKSVAGFSRREIVNYFRKHYASKHMIVSVAGDVDHADLKRRLNRVFKVAKLKRKRALANLTKPKLHAGAFRVKKDTEQAHVLLGLPGHSVCDRERFALSLLNVHLGGGMSSRLFQEVREKRGLAYSVYSSQSSFADFGMLTVYVGTNPGEVEVCTDLVAQELKLLREIRLDENTLKSLKENVKNTMIMSGDAVENHMFHLARSEMFYGRFLSTEELSREVDRVSSADIQRVAQEVCDPKRSMLAVMGGASGKEKRFTAQQLWTRFKTKLS